MACVGDIDAIRTCFDWLLGPVHSKTAEETKAELILNCLGKSQVYSLVSTAWIFLVFAQKKCTAL